MGNKVSAIVTGSDKSFEITETGLIINEQVTYEEWSTYGKQLAYRYSKIQWAIGDWINFGERKFGEMYSQAEDDTHFAYGTLRNYASVCARIPIENRHPQLRFHQVKHVACLEPHEQRAIIDAAVIHRMTGDDILEAVQKINGKKHITHDSVEGVVSRQYKQDDGFYLVVKLAKVYTWEPGQSVTLRTK